MKKFFRTTIVDITGNINEHIIIRLIQSNDVNLSLVMFCGTSGTAQRRFDSLIEGDEVGRVQGIVADAVGVVMAHPLARCGQPGQPQQNVVGKYHEYFHPPQFTFRTLMLTILVDSEHPTHYTVQMQCSPIYLCCSVTRYLCSVINTQMQLHLSYHLILQHLQICSVQSQTNFSVTFCSKECYVWFKV